MVSFRQRMALRYGVKWGWTEWTLGTAHGLAELSSSPLLLGCRARRQRDACERAVTSLAADDQRADPFAGRIAGAEAFLALRAKSGSHGNRQAGLPLC